MPATTNVMGTVTPEMINTMIEIMDAAPMVIGMIVVFALLIVIIERIVIGMICKRMAAKKGYKGYFWMGFFFGWLAFVYVVFLPDLKIQAYLRVTAEHIRSMDNRLEKMEADKNGSAA